MNGLLDATTAKFLGPLRFSKLNVFHRLSIGPTNLEAFQSCRACSQVYTSPPHITHSKASDECKAQIIHGRDLVKTNHTLSDLLLTVRSLIRYDTFYHVSFCILFEL